MKITIAYLPEEEIIAKAILSIFKRQIGGFMVKESVCHPPYKHIYMTTKKPSTTRKSKG